MREGIQPTRCKKPGDKRKNESLGKIVESYCLKRFNTFSK